MNQQYSILKVGYMTSRFLKMDNKSVENLIHLTADEGTYGTEKYDLNCFS